MRMYLLHILTGQNIIALFLKNTFFLKTDRYFWSNNISCRIHIIKLFKPWAVILVSRVKVELCSSSGCLQLLWLQKWVVLPKLNVAGQRAFNIVLEVSGGKWKRTYYSWMEISSVCLRNSFPTSNTQGHNHTWVMTVDWLLQTGKGISALQAPGEGTMAPFMVPGDMLPDVDG